MRRNATKPKIVGRSRRRRSILQWEFRGRSDRTTLLLGGMHGDEPKSVFVLEQLIEVLSSSSRTLNKNHLVIIPLVNPDGYVGRKRRNARGVDLNRNFPTENWERTKRHNRMYGGDKPSSEPETRAVMKIVRAHSPAKIITVHSIGRNRYCNNYDGPAGRWASKLSEFNGYPVAPSIGYPTPGSFGTWAGREQKIPTITLELPSHHSPKRCWEGNRDAFLAII